MTPVRQTELLMFCALITILVTTVLPWTREERLRHRRATNIWLLVLLGVVIMTWVIACTPTHLPTH